MSGRCCVHSSSSFDLEEQSSKQEDFKYLGGVEWNYGSLDKKINARICKASQTLRRLCVLMSNQHNSRQSTKLKAYNAVHLAWRMTGGLDTLQKTLEAARTILLPQPKVNPLHPLAGLNLTRITDLEVLERAGLSLIHI